MKRLVSILTALALTLALLSATLVTVSAADEADMVFDFVTNANKNWETYVYSEEAEYINSSGKNRTVYYSKNNGTQIYVGYAKTAKEYRTEQIGEWVSFKLDIAGNGEYEASLYNYESVSSYFKGFDVYMLPAPQTELTTDAEKREYIWDALNSGDYPATGSFADNASPHTFDITLEEGFSEYLFVLRRVGEDNNRFGFTKLTFTEKPEEVAPSEYNFDLTACANSSSPTYGLTSTEPSKVFSAEVTGNGWSAFVFKEDVLATNSSGTTNRTFTQTKDTNLIIEMKNANDWVSLLLPVSSGSYDAVLKSGTTTSYFSQGNHELYFIPITKSELTACSTDVLKREFVEGKIADRTYYAATTPRAPAGDRPTEFSFEVDMPETADYLVCVIKKTGLGSSETASALHLSSLSLTKQPETIGDAHENVKLYTYAKDGRGEVSGAVEDVASGAETTVTATANAGYEFAYWTDASGDFVSEKISYTFTPYTNTVLVAVFKEKTASTEVGVDFYDANRDYLGFVPVTAGENFASIKESAPTPSMTGLKHIGWGIDKNTEMTDATVIDKRVSVVALYADEEVKLSQTLTYMTDENEHKAVTSAVYGSEIKQTVSGVTKWYRDGKPVAYGDTYQYFVWDPTGITLSKAKLLSKRPIVLLDDPANGAYMIEYDEGNGTALEAGLLFGKTAEITVSNCYAKAKTQSAKAHGQFSAKPASGTNVTEGMQTYVRGYLIYKDTENVIRVIYTDAAEITE